MKEERLPQRLEDLNGRIVFTGFENMSLDLAS